MNRRDFTALALSAFTPVTSWAAEGHRPTGYIRTNWSKDPFSRGSYSYVAANARNRDRKTLGQSIDNKVFFAGEACNPESGSGVHSALQSSQIAVDEILSLGIKDITIIGAGVSGLNAAHALSRKGLRVRVLEGRNRIGGRILTDRTGVGFPVDLGASWIHNAQNNPVTAIADALSIKRVPTKETYDMPYTKTEPEWFEEVLAFQHGLGASSDQVRWRAYLFETALDGDQLVFPDGYDQIFKAFAGDYDLQLQTVLQQVEIMKNGVKLATSAGAFESEAVLITVPLGVLKAGAITFKPALPKAKQSAINRMGFGLLDKIYLRFDTPFWETDAHNIVITDTGLPVGQFNVWINFQKIFGVPVLMGFNGAQPAHDLAMLSDEDLLTKAISVLNRAYA